MERCFRAVALVFHIEVFIFKPKCCATSRDRIIILLQTRAGPCFEVLLRVLEVHLEHRILVLDLDVLFIHLELDQLPGDGDVSYVVSGVGFNRYCISQL